MDTANATLSNFRQSPRKMRLVANLVKGKKANDALVHLEFTAKKASTPIRTLIVSAIANAKSLGMDTENLVIKKIEVNSGKIMYRRIPAARGSAHPIRKRTSQIYVELGTSQVKKSKKIKKENVEVQAPAKKVVAKKTTKTKAKKED